MLIFCKVLNFTKNENRHKTGRRALFLKSDQSFRTISTTPDTFRRQNFESALLLTKKEGVLFQRKKLKCSQNGSWCIENQHKLMQTGAKFRENAHRDVEKFTGRVSEQF